MLSNPLPLCNAISYNAPFLGIFFFFLRLYSIGEVVSENDDSPCCWGKNVLLFECHDAISGYQQGKIGLIYLSKTCLLEQRSKVILQCNELKF